MSSASVVSDLQSINPSAIIELFTLTTTAALHGSATTHRFHNGTSLKDNGEIVWAGDTYQRFPIQAEGFAFQKGQLHSNRKYLSSQCGLTKKSDQLKISPHNQISKLLQTALAICYRHNVD